MAEIEDQLRLAAKRTHAEAASVDVDARLRELGDGRSGSRITSLLGAFAAITMVLIVGSAIVVWRGSSDEVVTEPSGRSAAYAPEDGEIVSRVVGRAVNSSLPVGSLTFADTDATFAEQVRVATAIVQGTESYVHPVELGEWAVIGVTVAKNSGCAGTPSKVDVRESEVLLAWTDSDRPNCVGNGAPETYFVAVPATNLPRRFVLVLPSSVSGAASTTSVSVIRNPQ